MGKRGRPQKYKLMLTQVQKAELAKLLRQREKRTVAFRSRIIVRSCSGLDGVTIARDLKTTPFVVSFWRKRFATGGVRALFDEPRPGVPRSVSDEQVANVVKMTLESKPKGATHWSTRSMAKRSGLSQSTVSRIWRAFGLQPHRKKTFQLSSDPLFVEKVRDVVGLYMNPPVNAMVLCVDEKSQIQALNRTQPVLPMGPGRPEQHTHEYQRHGVTSLFAALDVATGNVVGQCYRRHRSVEFRRFLECIDKNVPADIDKHIILDNYATHKTRLVHDWLLRHPRYHLHFTPTHSSWINQVERWFELLTEKQIKRGSHFSIRELETDITEFITVHNVEPKPFVWTKSADQILQKVKRFASKTLQTHG